MKKLVLLAVVAMELLVAGCGNNNITNVINTETNGSNWEARLTGGTGPASELNFVTTFAVVNNGPLSFPQTSDTTQPVGFINAGPCFVAGENTVDPSGTANLTTANTGQVTGTMSITISSTVGGNNSVLTLSAQPPNGGVNGTSNGTTSTTGTLSNGVVWGTWTLTNSSTSGSMSGCNGSGNFVMCQGTETCTIP